MKISHVPHFAVKPLLSHGARKRKYEGKLRRIYAPECEKRASGAAMIVVATEICNQQRTLHSAIIIFLCQISVCYIKLYIFIINQNNSS